jgi:hypothetical protein
MTGMRPQFSLGGLLLATFWMSVCLATLRVAWLQSFDPDFGPANQQAFACLVGASLGAAIGALAGKSGFGAVCGFCAGFPAGIAISLC